MTDRRTRPRVARVYAASATVFVAAAGGLGWQMAQGHDPALGLTKASASASKPAAAPRRVLIRRIEQTTVITRLLPPKTTPATAAAGTPVSSGAGTPVAAATPVAVRSAAAPAPVRAAAPAPAPAPPPPPPAPVTKTS